MHPYVYVRSGAIHVISNALETDEASLIFCCIGVPNTYCEQEMQ